MNIELFAINQFKYQCCYKYFAKKKMLNRNSKKNKVQTGQGNFPETSWVNNTQVVETLTHLWIRVIFVKVKIYLETI